MSISHKKKSKSGLLMQLSLLLVFILAAVIIYVYLGRGIFQTDSRKVVYVNLESLLPYVSGSFDLEYSEHVFPVETVKFDNIDKPDAGFGAVVSSTDTLADVAQMETKIYRKAMESQKEFIEDINETLIRSVQMSRERNINLGLFQVRPQINEYKSFIRTQMMNDISDKFQENADTYLKWLSADNYNKIFLKSNKYANISDNLFSELNFQRSRNSMLFQHYFDMSELFSEQEINQLINNIEAESFDYMSYRKDSIDKKYEKSMKDIRSLLEHGMSYDFATSSGSYISLKNLDVNLQDLHLDSDSSNDYKYIPAGTALRNLKEMVLKMAEDVNVSVTFTKNSDAPDYTNIFKNKLLKDSWKYDSCLISNLGG